MQTNKSLRAAAKKKSIQWNASGFRLSMWVDQRYKTQSQGIFLHRIVTFISIVITAMKKELPRYMDSEQKLQQHT